MKILIVASAVATLAPVAIPAPALALDHGRRDIRQEQRECERELRRADSRWEYERELRECRREMHEKRWNHRGSYAARHYQDYDWNRYEPGYDGYHADRYYQSGSYYPDRRLSRSDRIYRGQDGRYYCRRNDGSTGLIIGAGLGALLGNQVNIGGSRTLNAVLGGAAGAAIGHAIDKGNVRCD